MVAKKWSSDDVNGHLNDLLDLVKDEGPQEMTRNDETYVIVTAWEWRSRTDQPATPVAVPITDQDSGQAVVLERSPEWNDQEFRNPFAWVGDLSEEEVDVWEQQMEQARKRRSNTSLARER